MQERRQGTAVAMVVSRRIWEIAAFCDRKEKLRKEFEMEKEKESRGADDWNEKWAKQQKENFAGEELGTS